MNVPGSIDIGSATHTGHVRANNEDDFLVVAPPPDTGLPFVAGIADGMGGAAGGAEASRLGLRTVGVVLLDADAATPPKERMAAGFAAAAARVHQESANVPALRGMGTTLSVLCVAHGVARIGHVGDTRIYLVRDGVCEQLTRDHAVRHPDNLLTRCVGGGSPACEVDQVEVPLRRGDRFLLVSDGVWSAIPPDSFARLVGKGGPQATAEALVAQALAAGGTDNATAVVVDVVDPAGGGAGRSVDLPRDERPGARAMWPRPMSLRPPVWPWLVFAAAAGLLGIAIARWCGVDVRAWMHGVGS